MTLTHLWHKYNLHDCDVFLPFQTNQNSISVVFDLAKHLQHNDLKLEHKDVINDKDFHLIVKVKFSEIKNVHASEWTYVPIEDTSKSIKLTRCEEHEVTVEHFDKDLFLYSITLSDDNSIVFLFDGNDNKGGEIQFYCEDVQILDEKFVNEAVYDKLWSGYK
jgi:hypothetical protein